MERDPIIRMKRKKEQELNGEFKRGFVIAKNLLAAGVRSRLPRRQPDHENELVVPTINS